MPPDRSKDWEWPFFCQSIWKIKGRCSPCLSLEDECYFILKVPLRFNCSSLRRNLGFEEWAPPQNKIRGAYQGFLIPTKVRQKRDGESAPHVRASCTVLYFQRCNHPTLDSTNAFKVTWESYISQCAGKIGVRRKKSGNRDGVQKALWAYFMLPVHKNLIC